MYATEEQAQANRAILGLEPRPGGALAEADKVYTVRWRLQTQVDSFEDLSNIETSTGDEDEAEAIVKENVEMDAPGAGQKAFTSWVVAQRAMQAQTDVLLRDARKFIKAQLAEKKLPMTDAKYQQLCDDGIFDRDLDDMETVGLDPEHKTKDRCKFTIGWGPGEAGVALDKIDEYVAACEGFVTEGEVWLETLELDRMQADDLGVYDSRDYAPEVQTAEEEAASKRQRTA
jgi:hypothetical protein